MRTQVPIGEVQRGDLAQHVSGQLPPRMVSDVLYGMKLIRLRLTGRNSDWLPMDNYTFWRLQ